MNQHQAYLRIGSALLVFLSLAVPFSLLPTKARESSLTRGSKSSVDRAELHQALLDLTSPWTVMCVAAHPDDEDGTTLTMLRRKYGVHTVSLFSTYGEGGQNAIGPELYQELGLIRARETMAASEIQGSEPHFLSLSDFGYSKSAEETFRVWGEKEALKRMVLKIRQLRPDVIITNHSTVRGHGHHQATGGLILQAFDAAAERNKFPEQLKEFDVWQPKRLFVRFGSGSNPVTKALEDAAEKAERIVTVDGNEHDPVRNATFGEQALAALQQHATQGPWPKTVAERLRAQNRTELPLIRYRLAREVGSTPALPANAKSFVEGLLLPLTTGSKLAAPAVNDRPITDFVDKREDALVALINARKGGAFTAPAEVVELDPQRFRLMSDRLDRAIAVASGVSIALKARGASLVPGIESQFTATITNSGEADIVIRRVTLTDWGVERPLEIAEKLPPGTDTSVVIKSMPPKSTHLTVPSAEHLYDGRFLGGRIALNSELEIEGVMFELSTELRVPVVPMVEITRITPSPYVRTRDTAGQHWVFSLTLTNHLTSPFRGEVRVDGHDYHILGAAQKISLNPGETREITVRDSSPLPSGVAARTQTHSETISISVEATDSPGTITQRRVRGVYNDARVSRGLRVGYLPSFDETLQQALAALGLEAKRLSVRDILESDLASYSTIIVDNRGYEAHGELIDANQRLLDYVRNGGTLLVFYHKANEWNPDEKKNRPQLAPYPIILGDERVTEEDAPVELLKPGHPLLRFPNRITQADFRGWIQERGLYYPEEWDRRYEVLLSSHDKGEPPLSGGLLVARYGKGNYIYTSMVWYRQLQAGVAGAYRGFANMISYRGSPGIPRPKRHD